MRGLTRARDALAVVGATAAIMTGVAVPGASGTGYPYPNAPDCDEYGTAGCVPDRWNFYQGQCTSWVAWRLNARNGIPFHNWYGGVRWGDASNWDDAARSLGIRVDSRPGNGAVAHYAWHVAYVERVNADGSLVLSDMNSDLHNRQRPGFTVRPGDYWWPQRFIHIRDLPSGAQPPTRRSVVIDEPRLPGPDRWEQRHRGPDSSYGYGNDSWTTTSIQHTRPRDINPAIWTWNGTSGGRYRVQVFIPRRYGFADVTYRLSHRGSGTLFTKAISQRNYAGQWVTLGHFRAPNAPQSYELYASDRSRSPYGTQIVYDAARIVPVP